jgi:carotenoid cleavage dioxygenase-like enzyme
MFDVAWSQLRGQKDHLLWSNALPACRFDGDAMVHAVHLEGGRAVAYTNHWLRTNRFVIERAAGMTMWPRVREFTLQHLCVYRIQNLCAVLHNSAC